MISEKKLQEKIGFHPHKLQKEILNSKSRYKVICAGRRFGKSALCAYEILKILADKENKNKRIWVVAPTYDLSQKVFHYLVPWFLKVAPSQQKGVSLTPNRPPKIQMANGNLVEGKSTDTPQTLLGESLDFLIIDEAARISSTIWESYLYPTLLDRRGDAMFISTPLGHNWFYNEWLRAKESNGAFKFRTVDNPYISKEAVAEAKEKLPEAVFAREFEASFEKSAGVFRNITDIVSDNSLSDTRPGVSYVMGVDLGKYRDFTVLTVIDRTTNKVVFLDRFKETDWNLQKGRIVAACQRYNNAKIVIDSTGVGDPIADALRKENLFVEDFKYTNKTKQQMIEKLNLFIERKDITIPDNEVLIDELEAFSCDLSPSGKLLYSAPQGLHDDTVNSLGLAVWGLQPVKPHVDKPKTMADRLKEANHIIRSETYA